MNPGFVHLRVHSEYSIADSVIRIASLVKSVADMGMPSVAVTDKGNLFALVKFYKAALATGLKPLVGADVQVEAPLTRDGFAPLVLLARNAEGYLNLKRLITDSYVEGQRNGTPVINQACLSPATTGGLIALSGGKDGALGQYLLDDKPDIAGEWLKQHWRYWPMSHLVSG